jgi:hypothetical protein
LPPNASTLQLPAWVQKEPGSQSASRWQPDGTQWPVTGSQKSGAAQATPFKQPATHSPPEQMFFGAPAHSESLLQLAAPASRGDGQSGCAGSQQCPPCGSQRNPAPQASVCVQPATQVFVERWQTVSGGLQAVSSAQETPMPAPEQDPSD